MMQVTPGCVVMTHTHTPPGPCIFYCGRASPEEAFSASLYQMELDRLRYSLSKYLRTRLRKVERDALHVLASSEEEIQGRLSDRLFLLLLFVLLFLFRNGRNK